MGIPPQNPDDWIMAGIVVILTTQKQLAGKACNGMTSANKTHESHTTKNGGAYGKSENQKGYIPFAG